jgi:hypothetical protein
VIGFLRFLGVMNAAVWFGAVVFFTLAVHPALAGAEMKRLFGEAYAGVVAQMIAERYFVLHYWCGVIAIVHQLAEWVYLGKPLQRFTMTVLVVVFMVNLAGGLWLQPKLKRLHYAVHGRSELVSPEVRSRAARSLKVWRGVFHVFNWLTIGGVGVFTWRVVNPPNGPRFLSANKFRS